MKKNVLTDSLEPWHRPKSKYIYNPNHGQLSYYEQSQVPWLVDILWMVDRDEPKENIRHG